MPASTSFRLRIAASLFFLWSVSGAIAQSAGPPVEEERFYMTSGFEYIFSFADIRYRQVEDGSLLRFAPLVNVQTFFHYDINAYAGLLTGMALRNVGFIYDIPDTDQRKKFRTYNIGIPVGLKLGRMNNTFFYGGYEVEIATHYKEKTFIDGSKEDKISGWFSDRAEPVQSSLFLGIQLPYALNLRFKYYLTPFLNRDFSEVRDGVEVFPYQDLEARVFYLSVSFSPFRNDDVRIR